jgi:rhodanese-related sulfurtransferase
MKWLKFFISPKKITWDKVNELFLNDNDNKYLLLDVRQPFEHKEQSIKNSVLIPLLEISQKISMIDKNKTIFVFCRSGKRSSIASRILQTKGYKNLFSVKGGIKAFNKLNK